MRVIVAGGRKYNDMRVLAEAVRLFKLKFGTEVTEIVSGCATGADTLGIHYANANGIDLKKFPANWRPFGLYNPNAGKARNIEMAEYADGLITLPGDRGTAHMIREARKRELKCLVIDDNAESRILADKGYTAYPRLS